MIQFVIYLKKPGINKRKLKPKVSVRYIDLIYYWKVSLAGYYDAYRISISKAEEGRVGYADLFLSWLEILFLKCAWLCLCLSKCLK